MVVGRHDEETPLAFRNWDEDDPTAVLDVAEGIPPEDLDFDEAGQVPEADYPPEPVIPFSASFIIFGWFC